MAEFELYVVNLRAGFNFYVVKVQILPIGEKRARNVFLKMDCCNTMNLHLIIRNVHEKGIER